MKLNKNGWGLVVFLVFICLFIICLLITAVGLRRFGLLDENYHFIKFDNTTTKEEKVLSHTELENTIVESTKSYIKDFYNNNLGLDTLHIKVKSLKNYDYITDFKDSDGDCTGYVSVYLSNDNTIEYDPYIKCKNYTTNGYIKRHDE